MEQVYYVDAQDNVIGQGPLKQPAPAGVYRRGTKVLLFKDASYTDLLMEKRSKTAFFRPGCWDVPGGIVSVDESYEQCAEREIIEEALNGIVTSLKLEFLFKFRLEIESVNTRAWNAVFRGVYDGPLNTDYEEAEKHEFVPIKQVYNDVAEHPEKYTEPFIKLLSEYRSMEKQE